MVPVKLLRVFSLWLVLVALPSQGMGAGIPADCERAHAVIKKSRSIQHKRLSVATRTSHKHCHDHHGKAGPARYDDRCKLCPSCEEAPQYAVPARLTMSSCRPTARTHSSS